jgi:hypothetical protein
LKAVRTRRSRTKKILAKEKIPTFVEKIPTFVEKILKLEELATKLLETARQLPAGAERHDILKEIGTFRVRIAALRKSKPSPGWRTPVGTKRTP